jgi:hypothetical protein
LTQGIILLLVALSGVAGTKVSWGMSFDDATIESLGLSWLSRYSLLDRLNHQRVFLAIILWSSLGAIVVRAPGWQAWLDQCTSFHLLATWPLPNLAENCCQSHIRLDNAYPSNAFISCLLSIKRQWLT